MPEPFSTEALLARLRAGGDLARREQLLLVAGLALPAIIAEVSTTLMLIIDSAMIGHLGTRQAAAVGLMSSSMWFLWGLSASLCKGFTVQVAQHTGARDNEAARSALRQGLAFALAMGLALAALGAAVHGQLPAWLGGGAEVREDASAYFLILALAMPLEALGFIASAALGASGDMKTPSLLNVLSCALDVVLNALLIFPSRAVELPLAGSVWVPGAGLGVAGAALATAGSMAVTLALLLAHICRRSPVLAPGFFTGPAGFLPRPACLRRMLQVSLPMAGERLLLGGAYVASTAIIAPLGPAVLAANAFAIAVEGLCYMPGYGVSTAASVITGQCLGARRPDMARRLALASVAAGAAVMSLGGLVMYALAPWLMGLMTSEPEVVALGAEVLRIEAFAEPFFGAAIVGYGALVGAGDTFFASCANLGTMWGVRISLQLMLAPAMGLAGVWLGMAVELAARGCLFFARVRWGGWTKKRLID
ncbi:MAG: MATE family efflux transporter [Duodenibacillus sp.]|nr:MATE family efflux transporter [Duodenibacillus sp.]